MKKSELAFTAALLPIDYALVFAAALTAYSLRFDYLPALRPVIYEIPLRDFLLFAAVVSAVTVACYAASGLYGISGPRRLKLEISRVVLASSTAVMAVIVLIFFRGELFSSRFIVLAAWAFAMLYVCAGRVFVRLLQRLLLAAGIGVHDAVVIGGDDRTTRLLIAHFSSRPAAGHRVTRRFESFTEDTAREMDELATARKIDEIIVADPTARRADLTRLLGFAQSRHLDFKYSADLVETHATNIEMTEIAGVPMVQIKRTPLDGWGRIFKRLFDIIVSATLIVLTSPVMLIAAIAITLDSKGPVLFSRLDDGTPVTRVGERGKPFRYFKFRSMRPGTHAMRYAELSELDVRKEGPLVKIKDDPRVTRVGRFIRRFSLDELPELFLVLAGQMSLVGPRPHLPEEVAQYQDHHRRALTVKPGITGLAQVSGRADLDFEDEVRLDTYYIENWSPWLDLAILVKTPWVVLARKGAY